MDALKSAGRAIIKSPGVPRHTWGTSKHEKLPENWTDTKETLLEGMVFQVKYLGMTLVGQPKGEDMAAAAIHRIVSTARASAKKFRKVTLTISPKGIIITDTETQDLIENVSIYSHRHAPRDPYRTRRHLTRLFNGHYKTPPDLHFFRPGLHSVG
ncbi:Low density lipoprotein receptor adapter protein 1 [Salmo salar]|uniref:Low density lipoprotein receptor adapter protein 1 n=1 Tax=Salmo salar TaxID=8030 RepID=B9ELS7_SALSA|nr:Low density lipoprotein receptor adapter protein 1 [Salmo salar]ACM08474.1 Low density lipoprotein receptor adapter protein 1 [Salmo salar]|eukprot:NP_001139883.1 Low density lipoprotein receptor adapter protein 1 [Salmo salar]